MKNAFKIKYTANLSLLPIFIFLLVTLSIMCQRQSWNDRFYAESDPAGYYIYLPALFVDHDIGRMNFAAQKGVHDYYLYEQKATGLRTNKYPIGVAISEMPFFFLAHAWCAVTHSYPMDGYSKPYVLMGVVCNIAWAVLGLFVLRKFLRSRFNDTVVAITILCIGLGTNIYHYAAYDHGMSHCFSFFLFACVLYLSDKWHKTFMPRDMLLLGLVLGLVVITRPVNLVIAMLPLLWNVYGPESLKEKIIVIKQHWRSTVAGITVLLLLSCLQMAYWKYTSGHFIYFSYQNEYFDLSRPHIWEGLFSYRKGWFVYTPMALIGLLGFYPLLKKQKELVPVLALFFIAMTYIVFSWKMWWYGASFGCRPMVEVLAVLSLPLAALIERMIGLKTLLYKISFFILIAFFVALNIFQSYQFSVSIISYDRMTRAYYWRVFGKTKVNFAELEKYQLQGQDYWGPMEEITHP